MLKYVHNEEGKTAMKELEAGYTTCSYWNLEDLSLDLDKIHEWYVKWDTLHVMRTKDSKWEEFESSGRANTDYKRPYFMNIDGEEVTD